MENTQKISTPDPSFADPTPSSLDRLAALDCGSLPSRFLASFVDYLVVAAGVYALSGLSPGIDWNFVIALVFGGIYFSAGHSKALNGRTLGKRSFGLQVRELNTKQGLLLPPPDFGRSALRYLFAFGLLIILAELPTVYYRSLGVSSAPALLELHMLLVLTYFLLDIAVTVVHPENRALHDLISGTVVVAFSNSVQPAEQVKTINTSGISTLRGGAIAPIVAILLALLLWGQGLIYAPEVQLAHRARYQIENKFPLRIVSILKKNTGIEISALILPKFTEDSPEARQQLAYDLVGFLKESSPELSSKVPFIELQFFSTQKDNQQDSAIPKGIKINSDTLEQIK